ncbi:hypothetical protein Droror1_Dr00019393 [Drosera rotundifolia]
MAQLCPRMPDICHHVVVVRRYIRVLWDRVSKDSRVGRKPRWYQQLPRRERKEDEGLDDGLHKGLMVKDDKGMPSPVVWVQEGGDSSDLVEMKISVLGDRRVGKTSFLSQYVGNKRELGTAMKLQAGLNSVEIIQQVQGARLSFSIWEVGGDDQCEDHIPDVCKDSVAILFMFDLTSRCTLNNIIKWYQEARKWNQTAIPILIGTKFDEFVQLPIDLQWAIASQARAYAKALNATLFFSSSTYNINVNKVFKFITAKVFNLPWSVERNLNVGEPIIDF